MKTIQRSMLALSMLTAWVAVMTVAITRMLYLNPDILPTVVKSLGIDIVMFAGRFLDADGEKGKDIELLCFFFISPVAVLVITSATLRIFRFTYSVPDPGQEQTSDLSNAGK